jgi:hypothetical protein
MGGGSGSLGEACITSTLERARTRPREITCTMWTIGADVATMLTGLSVLTATVVWIRTQWNAWSARKTETRRRSWNDWITAGAIDTWFVRLAEEPRRPTATVVLEAIDRDGRPDEHTAHSIRQRVRDDGTLSRSPSPREHDFLMDLQKQRFGRGGGDVR